jgi:hypothetical protein
LFVEAPDSIDEMAVIGRSFDVPQLVNPLEGGRSPILSPAEYGELGFRMIGYGITLLLQAAKAMQIAIADIRTRRSERLDTGVSFDAFKDIVGFAEWARIEETGCGAGRKDRLCDVCRPEGDPHTIGTRAVTLRRRTPSLAPLEVWRAPLCGRGHAFPEIRCPALPLLLDEFTFGCGLDLLDQTAA